MYNTRIWVCSPRLIVCVDRISIFELIVCVCMRQVNAGPPAFAVSRQTLPYLGMAESRSRHHPKTSRTRSERHAHDITQNERCGNTAHTHSSKQIQFLFRIRSKRPQQYWQHCALGLCVWEHNAALSALSALGAVLCCRIVPANRPHWPLC